MSTAAECISRASQTVADNTNEDQREALATLLDPRHGHSYWFTERGMHVIQRGRKFTITPFGAIHHGA